MHEPSSGYVQQARARPNGVITFKSIKLIKAHHADAPAKTLLGFSGNLRRTVRWIDLKSRGDHRFGVPPSAAAKLQNARLRREQIKEGGEMPANPSSV